jgi:predicted DNA-binding transcriptional regulator AlpA
MNLSMRRTMHGPEAVPIKGAVTIQRLLTAKQAGVYLGFKSAWPIRELAWKGHLPVVRLGKRRIGFDIRDLDQFIESRKTVEQ